MTAPYVLMYPIKTLYKQITAGVLFAELGDAPFTARKNVEMVVLAVANKGVFIDDLKEWNRKPYMKKPGRLSRLFLQRCIDIIKGIC